MRWAERTQAGVWKRLELHDGPRRPGLRVELAWPQRVRLVSEERPLLWARRGYGFEGVAWLLGGHDAPAVVPPIPVADLRALDDGSAPATSLPRWARYFAQALDASIRAPLHEGLFVLQPASAHLARAPSAPRSGLPRIENAGRLLLREVCALDGWDLDGGGDLVPLHRPPDVTEGRVRAWRKWARDGRLPPILTWFVPALDTFVLLDGHARLVAAAAEGIAPAALVLSAIRTIPRTPNLAMQTGVLRRSEDLSTGCSGERLNELAIDAWDDRPHEVSAARAWPVAGGRTLWDQEVHGRLSALGRAAGPELATRMLA